MFFKNNTALNVRTFIISNITLSQSQDQSKTFNNFNTTFLDDH